MSTPVSGRPRPGGWRIARIRGIDIELDPSLALIFALVAYTLGAQQLAAWHPDWPATTRWLTALAAAVSFFGSLLGHELSHAVVAQRYGIRVPRIRLFLFGGQAEIEREPPHPRAEFLMAIAGPAFSLALGVGCLALASSHLDAGATTLLANDPAKAFATLGVLPTILFWLGSVNIVLAIFNMVPGFPLDGGRVLRALVWWLSGNRALATRWASGAGRVFGFALMALGAWTVLARQDIGGMWYVLMGWFLSHLAAQSGRQEGVHAALERVRVDDVMRTHFETVDAAMPLQRFVDDVLMRSAQPLWPVLHHGGIVGTVGLEQLAGADAATRQAGTVADVMTPLPEVPKVDAGAPAEGLLALQGATALVLDGTRVIGMAGAVDALKRIAVNPR